MSTTDCIDDLYAGFETDQDSEKNGVPTNYGKFVIDIARAGGSNDLYRTTFEAVMKPFGRAFDLNEVPEADSRVAFVRIYARSIIKRWRFRSSDGTLVQGLGRDKDGNILAPTEENLLKLFAKRWDLFLKIKTDAETMELFQASSLESAAGN